VYSPPEALEKYPDAHGKHAASSWFVDPVGQKEVKKNTFITGSRPAIIHNFFSLRA
jgi:hypothetical protein